MLNLGLMVYLCFFYVFLLFSEIKIRVSPYLDLVGLQTCIEGDSASVYSLTPYWFFFPIFLGHILPW
jgi:hypothetical protein